MAALGNDDSLRKTAPRGRRDQEILRRKNGQLPAREAVSIVGRADRDQSADPPALPHLHKVASDQATQAMANDIDPRVSSSLAGALDELPELYRQPLVVEAGAIAERGEPPETTSFERASQLTEMSSIAKKAVNKNDRGASAGIWVQRIAAEESSERCKKGRPRKRLELAPEVAKSHAAASTASFDPAGLLDWLA